MYNFFAKIFLSLFFFIIINSSSASAITEKRTALVIGNSAYSTGSLQNPINDATDIATILKKIGFSVILKTNASLREMEDSIIEFGNILKKGGVGLFFYAGHGMQINGTNYLLPIGSKVNKESDVKYEAVDANKILDEMFNANNDLNIVILDACRDNPFARSFRSAARGLAIVSSAPPGILISYSTSPGTVAGDGDGRNSPYTAALLEYIQTPGLSIGDVFIHVRTKVKKETGQVPWELSSLEGQFYFVPGSTKTATAKDESPLDASVVGETEVSFRPGTVELASYGKMYLEQLAKKAAAGRIRNICISPTSINSNLGQKRAQNVKNYLVGKGIESTIIPGRETDDYRYKTSITITYEEKQ